KALRVRHFFQKNLRAASLLVIRSDGLSNISLNDVVAQNDAHWFVAGEVLNQRKRCRDAALTFLIGVVEMLEAENFTVSQKLQKISRGISARNDHDVGDAGVNQGLNRVVNHRLIIDGQQVFVRDR